MESIKLKEKKVFKTKTGYCHILPDKIVLTRDGIVGKVANVTVGNHIRRPLVVYGVMSIILVYFAYISYQNEEFYGALFFGLMAVFLVYGVIASLNNSATPVIDRNSIKGTKFKKGLPGLIRSRFEILFEDENGKVRKRLIMLPGALSHGKIEANKAVEIMQEEGLLA